MKNYASIVVKAAQARKSSSTTLKGALRFLSNLAWDRVSESEGKKAEQLFRAAYAENGYDESDHLRAVIAYRIARNTSALTLQKKHDKILRSMIFPARPRVKMTQESWARTVAARTTDADIKRAKADKKYRKTFLARCRRELSHIVSIVPANLDAALHLIAHRSAPVAQAKELCRKIDTATGKTTPRNWAWQPSRSILELSAGDKDLLRKAGIKWTTAGKDWDINAISGESWHHYTQGETEWKGGKPKHYTRTENEWNVRALLVPVASDPRTAEGIIHTTRHSLTLQAGYTWGYVGESIAAIDQNGNEYHPMARDLARKDASAYICAQIATLSAKRAAEKSAIEAVEKAEQEGAAICLRDSIKAGNCEAGTRQFAARHGLDPQRHYRPTELLAIANGDAHRVRLAVAVGLRRHRQEMRQGFALLEDHR